MVLCFFYFLAFKNSSQVDGEGGRHVLRRTFSATVTFEWRPHWEWRGGGRMDGGSQDKLRHFITIEGEGGKRRAPGITY